MIFSLVLTYAGSVFSVLKKLILPVWWAELWTDKDKSIDAEDQMLSSKAIQEALF